MGAIGFRRFAAITGILVLVDQGTKCAVRACLTPGSRVPIIDGILYLAYTQNYRGVSWFVPDLPDWVHIVFYILRVVIVLMAFPAYRFYTETVHPSRLAAIAVAGLTAGVLGNLIDSFYLPYTPDFFQVFNSPSANLADLFAYFGIAALVLESVRWYQLRKPRWRGIRAFLIGRQRIWMDFAAFIRRSITRKI